MVLYNGPYIDRPYLYISTHPRIHFSHYVAIGDDM